MVFEVFERVTPITMRMKLPLGGSHRLLSVLETEFSVEVLKRIFASWATPDICRCLCEEVRRVRPRAETVYPRVLLRVRETEQAIP